MDCAIQWIEIHPVNRAIHLSNNWQWRIQSNSKSSPLSMCVALLKIHVFKNPPHPPPPPQIRHPSSVKYSPLPTPSHLQQIQNSNKTRKKMSLWTDQITIFNSHLFKYSFEYSDLELTFWIRYESRIVWTPKSGYSFSWIVQSRWQPRFSQGRARWNFPRFTTHARCSVANIPIGVLGTRVNQSESRHVSDTCGWANSIWIRIRVDVEIFQSRKKKLRIQKYPDTCRRGLIIFLFWGEGAICLT